MFIARPPYEELTEYLSQKSDEELTQMFYDYTRSYELTGTFEKMQKKYKASWLAILIHNARTIKYDEELESLIEKTIENVTRMNKLYERIESGTIF